MTVAFSSFHKVFQALLLCAVVACVTELRAQQPSPSPTPRQEDVVRVYTELVQTDVTVLDKQGRFVNGLAKDDFELRIDGRVRPIQSFEQVTAGSDEEAQLAAARGSNIVTTKRVVPLDRGRTVMFYVDDFHLDLAGLNAAKKVISTFIDKEMGQNDEAAISSATGQIGFLQQLTNDRSVLKDAMARLSFRSYSVRDFDRPPMSEYEAVLIDRYDMDLLDFFITETIRQNPGMSRDTAASIVHGRAQQMLAQAGAFTNSTLLGLQRLVKSARQLPGRKVVFFLSNGFLIENRRTDAINRIREITDSAARSGVVIYSLDTRGLIATLDDISVERAFDPTGRVERATHDELPATQDGLNALAADTGGRAIFNTNDLAKGLAPALKETSVYYLLAWKPENPDQKQTHFRKIEVSVIGKPELTVRVRRGFFDVDPNPPTITKDTNSKDNGKSAVAELKESILAPYPKLDLPLTLALNYYDVIGKGPTVAASVQVPGELLIFGPQPDGKIQAIMDVTGVFYNERGQPGPSFAQRLVTTAPSLEASKQFDRAITYTYPVTLAPGLYQIRVAARDAKSGRIGSAHSWIRIPDLTQNKLALSSLLLGEQLAAPVTNVSTPNEVSQAVLSINHRFRKESTIRLLVFTYNSTVSPTDKKPDIAVQVQVIRDDQPVLTTSLRKVDTTGVIDASHIPYAADVLLSDLLPGRYVLQVSVIDRVAKQSATQQTHFEIY